jgi:LCP family protein required for cell wall assembly
MLKNVKGERWKKMSRVDRYKHIHENAKPADQKKSKKNFNPRRSVSKAAAEPERSYSRTESANEAYDRQEAASYQQAAKKKIPKQKPPKKKRKRSWFKRIILALIAFILIAGVYSAVMFNKGKKAAENDTSLPKEEIEAFQGVTSQNGANNILILGSDTRGEDAGRSDTIMVLQLDGPSKQPKLVSFMRDTFVTIPGVGDNKINAAYAYGGADLVRQTLSDNFGIDCKYYAKVDFQSFEKIADSLFPNGVKIDAEKSLNLDGVDIAKGEQKMDGHVLLQYARFRMDEEGDFGRVRRQQQVMSAVMSQLKSPMTLLRAPESLGKMIGYMSTDVPTSFMVSNGASLLKGKKGVATLTVPVADSWSFADSDYAGSVLEIDFEQNRTAIQNFLNQ